MFAQIGAGGVADLERRIRVHGNFAEYVPLTLLLIVMDELRGLNVVAVQSCAFASWPADRLTLGVSPGRSVTSDSA